MNDEAARIRAARHLNASDSVAPKVATADDGAQTGAALFIVPAPTDVELRVIVVPASLREAAA